MLNFVFHYFSYLIKSKNLHGIHSPFVYELVKNVIYNKKNYSTYFIEIEKIRSNLKKDKSVFEGVDFGAGTTVNPINQTIGAFAHSSSKSKKYATLLYRLAKWHQPHYALELGTALGISAMYQTVAFNEKTLFISLEGNSILAAMANKNIRNLNSNNVQIIEGNFDNRLPSLLENLPRLDWVFFDGNHKKEPTLSYFNKCLEKISNKTIFIFDDINWSSEMRQAWAEIKKHPKVSLTIDLFFIGLVFFNKREQKEDFVVRF